MLYTSITEFIIDGYSTVVCSRFMVPVTNTGKTKNIFLPLVTQATLEKEKDSYRKMENQL